MRVALDTNVLAYAEGVGDAPRVSRAVSLIERIPSERVLLPAQALGELYRVLTGKARRAPGIVRTAVLGWADSFEVADSTWTSFQAALDLSVDHGMPVWDALILSVAAENRCRLLLSEDLQDGFTWRGVTVANPFAMPLHPLLEGLVARG
jgi:predicted nucleic acid-binding protein